MPNPEGFVTKSGRTNPQVSHPNQIVGRNGEGENPSPPHKAIYEALSSLTEPLLPQERQHTLWTLVGLSNHGGTGLLQHLSA